MDFSHRRSFTSCRNEFIGGLFDLVQVRCWTYLYVPFFRVDVVLSTSTYFELSSELSTGSNKPLAHVVSSHFGLSTNPLAMAPQMQAVLSSVSLKRDIYPHLFWVEL
jgi:hypothetical protein